MSKINIKKRMRLLLVMLSLTAFAFIIPTNTGTENEVIVWQKDRPLTWDDFKGKPAKRFAVASTNYDINKIIEQVGKDSSTVEIKAIFFCNKSWKKQDWIDETVLAHEQKHFDIVELYARKLRKMVASKTYTSFNDLKTKSDSLYAVIDKAMDVYQDEYDEKTEGSMNGEQQRLWNKKIIDQIKELDNYSSSIMKVGFQKK
ncbi:MAG: hypothetical protein WAQ28_14800 [Bacteroidia bacterium]|jgi:hypothetical protein